MVLGFIGGMVNVVVNSEKWEDLKSFNSFKKTVLGAVCGLVYSYLYSEYDWPNSIMSFISGYAGQDFILRLIEKYQVSKKNNHV